MPPVRCLEKGEPRHGASARGAGGCEEEESDGYINLDAASPFPRGEGKETPGEKQGNGPGWELLLYDGRAVGARLRLDAARRHPVLVAAAAERLEAALVPDLLANHRVVPVCCVG